MLMFKSLLFPVAVPLVAKKVEQNVLIKVYGRREETSKRRADWIVAPTTSLPLAAELVSIFFSCQVPQA